ncbi:MAG: N-acetylmuramoyl-L-alanine amidase [Bacillota bacterium]
MIFPKPPVVWGRTINFGYPQGRPGRNGRDIMGICYHVAEGSRASVESWFGSPKSQASSHFLVCRDGAVVQFVAEEDAAWTQGDTQAVTWPLYDRAVNPNLVLLGIEHEGYPHEPWTEAMIQADVALTLHLCERFAIPPRRPHLLGHHELNGRTRRNCPGPHFPWARLIEEVQRTYARQVTPWLADAISLGFAHGLTDGTRPLDPALRGEAMAVFVRVLEKLSIPPQGPEPAPVTGGAPDWMRPYIQKAIQYKISDGRRPLEEATRAEAMAIAVRTLDAIAPWLNSVIPAAPGQDELDRARQEQISDGTRPHEVALRAEVVAMAVRLLDRFLRP